MSNENLGAEVARLQDKLGLYEQAASIVKSKIDHLQRVELNPVAVEIDAIRMEIGIVQRRIEVAGYLRTGDTEAARTANLAVIQGSAVRAYNQAIQTPGLKNAIAREWDTAMRTMAESKKAVGAMRPDRTTITHTECEAECHNLLLAVTARMNELGALPAEHPLRD